MKQLTCIVLTIVSAFIFRTQAQTPYDSFAPESTRPMLGLDALHAMKQESTPDTKSGIVALDGKIIAYISLADDVHKWMSVDPLSDKYPSISPYVWCGNNPIKFVDPDGNKVWKLDENGNLEHSEDDNTQDALIMNGKQITFEYGSIKDVVQEKSGQTTFTFGDANVAAEAFKFLSENSGVEYMALLATENDSKIYTQHILDKVACNFSQHMESAPSTYLMMHNHPGNTRPSGFSEDSKRPNDRLTVQSLMDRGILLASCVYCPKYGVLIPYDAIQIYSYRNWESVFPPSGKMLTYLRPEIKYLNTDPVYPTIHIH